MVRQGATVAFLLEFSVSLEREQSGRVACPRFRNHYNSIQNPEPVQNRQTGRPRKSAKR